ncbi:MAG: hypothetical protein CALGDGBN_01245 [Pseudomonadales bacterium]|nr:hypothetical protein [Pseudomonadales bacterium]
MAAALRGYVRVEVFLSVLVVAVLFVLGPMLAMRPSPRQAQLARLRASATANGLRVRIDAVGTRAGYADYVLPWSIEDHHTAQRASGLAFEREEGGAWRAAPAGAAAGPMPGQVPQDLPAGVVTLRASAEGLVARWNEKGREADVARIATALRALGSTLAERR